MHKVQTKFNTVYDSDNVIFNFQFNHKLTILNI